ncbi:LCP family protein [Actinophytocola gossypii]|uniref:LCP family protein n=1 Tax=Actinophytocola gossypii TaxID=2812003 RepID=UPI0021A2CC47|nr:LCP family protein [Actinophytocola gossypii]
MSRRAGGRVPPGNARRTGGRPDPDSRTERIPGGRDSGGDLPRYRRPAPRTSDARWEPRPEPPPPPRRPTRSNPLLTGGKVVLTVVSVLVLVATGYYWVETESFGLTTADVIDEAPQERPADGAIDILMVGMDSRTDAQGNPLSEDQLRMLSAGVADGELNTDTLIMIRIPNDGKRAVGVSMPRDSYVEIPGYGKHKINSAYLRAKSDAMERLRDEGMTDESELHVESNKEGAKKLIETVEQLTGATIDRYAEVNLLGFYDITRAIGGIEVCLKEPVDDEYSGAEFPAGRQTIQGVKALAFVRQRHGLPNGDLDRVVRQQVFMNGMAKKVFSKDILAPGSDTLDKLRDAIQKSVVLSEDWDIIEFAQDMMGFTGGKLSFETIPVGSIALDTPEDGSAVEVDPDEVQAFVDELLGDAAPKDDSSQPPAEDEVPAEDVTVNVLNTTTVSGLADSVSTTLGEQGFTQGVVGNADPRDATVVRHASGEEAYGNRVAEALDGPATVEPDANLAPGTVNVLLGSDFDTQDLAGDPLLNLSPGSRLAAQPDSAGCVY